MHCTDSQVIDEEGEISHEVVWVRWNSGMVLGFASLVVVLVVLIHALGGIVGSRSGVDGTIDDAERPPIQGLP